MSDKLSIKQMMWAEYYIMTRNGTQAARMAGYRGNDNTLANVGSQNLRKPKIVKYMDKRLKELQMSADEVLYYLAEHAQGRVSDFMKPIPGTGFFKVDIDKVMERGHLIKKITMRKGQGVEIELHNPLTALKMLGEYHQLFTQKVKIEDWRTEVIELLKQGKIDPEIVTEELGKDLASELFVSAGIPISQS